MAGAEGDRACDDGLIVKDYEVSFMPWEDDEEYFGCGVHVSEDEALFGWDDVDVMAEGAVARNEDVIEDDDDDLIIEEVIEGGKKKEDDCVSVEELDAEDNGVFAEFDIARGKLRRCLILWVLRLWMMVLISLFGIRGSRWLGFARVKWRFMRKRLLG